MARLSPWLTDSDGGGERRLATDGGEAAYREHRTSVCVTEHFPRRRSLFISHPRHPWDPLPSAAALFPYAGPGRARLHLIR